MIAALVVLAGLVRALVGMSLLGRWLVYPPLCALCAYVGFGLDWWAIPFAVIPALTLGLGWTDWGNRIWMTARYGIPSALLVIAYAAAHNLTIPFEMTWWVGICFLYGFGEGDVRSMLQPYSFTVRGHVVSSAQYAEFLCGAIVAGLVAAL